MTAGSVRDLLTRWTLEWIQSVIALDGRRVVDVGCGEGHLAVALSQAGAEVVGVEPSQEAASMARDQGVDVRPVDFLEFDEGPFDVVLFTRSLHHIPEVEKAVQRSADLLAPGGLLLLEEFDVEAVDEATLRWFYDTMYLLRRAGLADEGPEQRIEDLPAAWQEEHHHHHPLHPAKVYLDALSGAYSQVEVSRGPYFFWKYCRHLRPDAEAIGRALFEVEQGLLREKRIVANGVRVIARP